MKLTAIFLLAAFVHVSAETFSQNVTIHENNASLENVLTQIEKQSKFHFLYKPADLAKSGPVDVQLDNIPLEKALGKLLGNQFSYKIIRGIIVLKKIDVKDKKFDLAAVITKIRGTVKDTTGQPIPGVSVTIKGTAKGVVTDVRGQYSIDSEKETDVLIFSFIGFKTQQVALNGRSEVNLTLQEEPKALSEVVVVGYGSIKRTDITGAVSSISADQLTQVNGVSTIAQALQGQAAGVQVIQRSGQPGEGVSIKIRGTNSIQASNDPLYVVDGLPLDGLSAQLNPSDIESLEVLKDASSTAIYGSRGANGVIMITTKKGKEGKVKVSYNGYYGTQQLRKKIDVLNATEYAQLQNEVATNDGTPLPWTASQISALGAGTDWQDLVYKSAPVQNHDLSISGGSAGTKFYTSFGYFNQDGVIESSNFKRFSFRTNLDQKISEKLLANVSFSLQQSNYFQNNYFNGDGGGGVPFTSMVMPPTQGVYDANGKYTIFTGVPWGQSNPVAMAKEEYRPNQSLRLIGNVAVSYTILPGLKLKSSAGLDNGWNKSDYYAPSTISLYANGGGNKSYNNSFTFVNENLLSYTKAFAKHNIDVVGGMTYQSSVSESLSSGTATGFLTDIYQNNNINAATVKGVPGTGFNDNKLISYLGRANYSFASKYLLTLTGRYDGSSRFSKTNRFAFFPSGAVGWRVSEEAFMKNINAISNLKLRASYGASGNQGIGNYQTLGQLSNTNITLNNTATTTYFSSRLENNSLKWETTTSFDLGMDLGLFSDRFQLTADYYDKKTKDLLLNVTLPPSSGFGSVLTNLGSTGNKGVELQLNAKVLTSGPVKWNSTITYTSNRTKLLDLGKDALGNPVTYKEVGSGGNWFPMIIGQAMQQLYGYKVIGVYQTDAEAIANGEPTKKAGNYKFQNTDGNAVVDGNDRIILSNFQPKFTYGFNNDFSYKNFNLSFLLVGSVGNDLVNEFRKYNITMNGKWNPSREAYENRWVAGKGNNLIDKPSANSGSDIRDYANSLWLENGAYMRVRDITLAYNFNPAFLSKLKLSSLQLYISGQNLITVTKYSGYDPEVNTAGINGWDRGNYPSTKSFTGGVRANF